MIEGGYRRVAAREASLSSLHSLTLQALGNFYFSISGIYSFSKHYLYMSSSKVGLPKSPSHLTLR